VISPATIVYSGAIVWRSDPAAEEGLILIRFGTDDDCGMAGAQLDAKAGDRCVLAWRREGALLRASVYNDSPASIIPPGAGAGENRALPGPEAFAETTDSAGGLAASGAVWAEFSRA
jgi:hypothetical protein